METRLVVARSRRHDAVRAQFWGDVRDADEARLVRAEHQRRRERRRRLHAADDPILGAHRTERCDASRGERWRGREDWRDRFGNHGLVDVRVGDARARQKCAVDITGGAQTITSGTDTLSSISVTTTLTRALRPRKVICVTFSGRMRRSPVDQSGRVETLVPRSPPTTGWFTLHNVVPVVTMKSLIAPLGLNCMDSSVDTRACADGLSARDGWNTAISSASSSRLPSPVALTDFRSTGTNSPKGKDSPRRRTSSITRGPCRAHAVRRGG